MSTMPAIKRAPHVLWLRVVRITLFLTIVVAAYLIGYVIMHHVRATEVRAWGPALNAQVVSVRSSHSRCDSEPPSHCHLATISLDLPDGTQHLYYNQPLDTGVEAQQTIRGWLDHGNVDDAYFDRSYAEDDPRYSVLSTLLWPIFFLLWPLLAINLDHRLFPQQPHHMSAEKRKAYLRTQSSKK